MPEVRFKAGVPTDESREDFVAMLDTTAITQRGWYSAFERWVRANESVLAAIAKHGFEVAGSLGQRGLYSREELKQMARVAVFQWVRSQREKSSPIPAVENPAGFVVTVGKRSIGAMLRREVPGGDKAALRYLRLNQAGTELEQLLRGVAKVSLRDAVAYSQATASAARGMRPLAAEKGGLLVRVSDVTGDRDAAASIRRDIRAKVLASGRTDDIRTPKGREDAVVAYNQRLVEESLKRVEPTLSQTYKEIKSVHCSISRYVETALDSLIDVDLLARPSDLLDDDSGSEWDAESDRLRAIFEAERVRWSDRTDVATDVHKYVRATVLARGEAALRDKQEWVTEDDRVLKTSREFLTDDVSATAGQAESRAPLVDPSERRYQQAMVLQAAASRTSDPNLKVVIEQVLVAYAGETKDDGAKGHPAPRYVLDEPVEIDEESGADSDYFDAAQRARQNRRGFFRPKNKKELRAAFAAADLDMPKDDELARLIQRAAEIFRESVRQVDEYADGFRPTPIAGRSHTSSGHQAGRYVSPQRQRRDPGR